MKTNWKRFGSLVLAGAMLVSCFTGCGGDAGGKGASEDTSFKWWIDRTDGAGIYYQEYEENTAVQWMNNQTWDTENHTISEDGKGKKISLTFQTPISGAEADNYNTMISTGEYPEIINLSFAGESPKQLHDDGILMEITEYVEQYLPNYLALLEERPEMKRFTTYTDEEGKEHYYALYGISSNVRNAWQGYMYRRDWVVKYCEPSEYVWDWDSEYVKSNGHPEVTPLSSAMETGALNGWKKNEVKEFTSSEGEDPANDYTDNVIFPSGKTDPTTISDWEWMFEGFQKAIEKEGFAGDSNSYCISQYYLGYQQTGDLVSSFGGGGPMWYIDKEGNAAFGGTGENFKTFIECLHNWNEKGWLDTKFESRASDQFWMINETGYSQGMVGMWVGGVGTIGTTIRSTCSTDEGKKDAMVFPCALPINDVYGGEAQKYKEPDMQFQEGRLGTAAPVGFTEKCEGKDMEALFSMINWMYTFDGSLVNSLGLSEEQYKSMSFDPDLYKEQGITCAYSVVDNGDGTQTIKQTVPGSTDLSNALKTQRMACAYQLVNNPEEGIYVDTGLDKVSTDAQRIWSTWESTAYILDYNDLFTPEESASYSKINTYVNDYMGQAVPEMIKNGMNGWEDYCNKLNKYDPGRITEIYQNYMK